MQIPKYTKTVRYAVEGLIVYTMFRLLSLVPIPIASTIGGTILGIMGPLLPVNKKAKINLTRAMPHLEMSEINRIIRQMWKNLGRVAGEYPHLHKLKDAPHCNRIELVGTEHLEKIKNLDGGSLLFTGHLANWEIPGIPLVTSGLPISFVYRAPNNPIVDRLISKTRSRGVTSNAFPKGSSGAREIIRQLKNGGYAAMLVDQKMNDGIPVPFFGIQAMTAPALAQLAFKYNLPIWPVRTERLNGCRFRVTIYPCLNFTRTDNLKSDITGAMTQVNSILEEWIREKPAQWLWLHNRWPLEH